MVPPEPCLPIGRRRFRSSSLLGPELGRVPPGDSAFDPLRSQRTHRRAHRAPERFGSFAPERPSTYPKPTHRISERTDLAGSRYHRLRHRSACSWKRQEQGGEAGWVRIPSWVLMLQGKTFNTSMRKKSCTPSCVSFPFM